VDVLGDSSAKHIQLAKFDQCALLVEVPALVAHDSSGRRKVVRPFRCEDMWFRHAEYKEMVKQTWDLGSRPWNLTGICTSLKSMQGALKKWNKEVFNVVQKQIKEVCAEIEWEHSQSLYRGPTARERCLVEHLSELLVREEAMERQHSRRIGFMMVTGTLVSFKLRLELGEDLIRFVSCGERIAPLLLIRRSSNLWITPLIKNCFMRRNYWNLNRCSPLYLSRLQTK
jgi:hypothetical protein